MAPMESAYRDKQDIGLEVKTKPPPLPPHKPTKPGTNNPSGPACWTRFRLSLRLPAPPTPPAYVHLSPIHSCHPRCRARAPSAGLHLCSLYRNSPKETDASAPPGVATTVAAGGPEAGQI